MFCIRQKQIYIHFQIIVFVWGCQRSVLYSAAVPAAPGSAVAPVLRTKPCVSGSL